MTLSQQLTNSLIPYLTTVLRDISKTLHCTAWLKWLNLLEVAELKVSLYEKHNLINSPIPSFLK